MDTDKLRYFSAVAESGSLTRAAQILGISHSGLSKAISALEEETQVALFRPLGRGLEITQEGKWLYTKAQEILKIADEIRRGKKVEKSVVRIGLSEVLAITCAGALAEEFAEPIALSVTDVGELEGKIVSGELDFGLAFVPSPRAELEYLEVGEVRMNSYAREDLAKRFEASEIPFVVPSTEAPFNPLGYRIRDGWPKDIARNPFFSASCFAIAIDLLRAGKAAAYMPDFIAAQEEKIVKVKAHAKAETKRKLFLVKPQAAEESREMKKAAKVLRKICCGRA